MSQPGNPCAGTKVNRLPHIALSRLIFAGRHIGKQDQHPQPSHATPRPRRKKRRRQRCDCGRLAITVLRVRVGSNPQYMIRLPLCPACLNLERELHA